MAQVVMPGTIPWVDLVVEGDAMSVGSGLVYSTDPRSWMDAGRTSYVVKGPELNIVVAEAVAYELAASLGLRTPGYSLARKPDDHGAYFASHKLEYCVRDAAPWLDSPTFPLVQALSELLAFDIWIANEDRNLGGLLGVDADEGISLVFVDFEKSVAIRGPAPIVACGALEPKKLRPQGELYTLCKQANVSPGKYVSKICAMSDGAIKSCVSSVKARIAGFDWDDSVEICLQRRRDKLAARVKEVWP